MTLPPFSFLQTVRRPAKYYAHLIDAEVAPLDGLQPERRRLLDAHEECFEAQAQQVLMFCNTCIAIHTYIDIDMYMYMYI